MPIIYSISTENARLQAVVTQIDAGPGVGNLVVGTAGMAAVLATIPLAKPSGAPAGGVLTFVVPQAAIIAVGGVAAAARLEDSVGTIVASGLTVGTSSGFDLIILNTTISAGDTLSLVSATITGN